MTSPALRRMIARSVGAPGPGKEERPSDEELRWETIKKLRAVIAEGEDRDAVQAARVMLIEVGNSGKRKPGDDLSALSDEQVEQMAKGAANQQAKG